MESVPLFLKAIGYVRESLNLIKQAKDLMPDGPKKEEAIAKLKEAEENFKTAEIEAAKKLGHKICQCTWPSQIMLLNHSKNVFKCPNPKCGREIKAKRTWPSRSFNKT